MLTAGIVSLLRDPGAVTAPVLAWEDGRDLFAYFYNHPDLVSVFRLYNGYVALVPNLAGWLALRAPVTVAPHLVAGFALAFSSLAFAWIGRPAYRWLVPSDAARFVAGLCLALVPLGNYLFVGNLMYAVWSLLLVTILQTALAPPPASLAGTLAALALGTLLVWSHPLSVLLVPVWLALAVAPPRFVPGGARPRWTPLLYGGYAASALLYQALAVQPAGAVGFRGLLDLRLTGWFLLDRVVVGTLLGDGATRALRRDPGDAAVLGLAGFLLLAVAVGVVLGLGSGKLGRADLAVVGLFALLLVGLTFLYVLTRDPDVGVLRGARGFRYFWVQRALWLLFLFWLGSRLVPRRWIGPGTSAVATALVGAWLVLTNLTDGHAYRVNRAEGARVAALVEEIATQEEERGGRINVYARLERGIWSVEVNR